jgi:alpha-tubulin suppressor-like RCC1 family protein
MRLRALPPLAFLLFVSAVAAPHAQQLRKIGEMELALVGLSATVDGARPAIPKNVASGVKILIKGGGATLAPGAAARLLGQFNVEAELSGPSFGETVTVRQTVLTTDTASDLVLPLPVMAVAGEHTLSNLRIVNQDSAPILDLQPRVVPVDVVDQVLITSVRTRALTLQEIKDKGIVLDRDDYLGFEFTLGVLLESKPVRMSFPVVFDSQGIAVPLPESLPTLDVDSLREPVIVPKLVPMMMKIPKLGAGSTLGLLDFKEEDIKIPSLLVIPGEVGYLKQFFSAQLFVGNGTPATANLTVRDLKGTITLPDNPDANSPDPLALAETINGPQPTTMTIAAVGPDGKPATADDITSLRAGEQGMAEFLIRGDAEGFHNISFALEGVLDGLPTGPITVTGTAKGGVLVRNGFFDVSFTLPTVVRAEEPFKLYATLTNKGGGAANLVSMTLDTASMSGVQLQDDATKSIDTIKPGEAATLVFKFKALRTGQAVATYLNFDGDAATGNVRFKIGVGERGVPLSPDTLVLPAEVDELPDDVIATAMRVLGQAWSIANTPPNAMPAGVVRISKAVVTTKALALAEAGLRIRLGQPAATAIRDLLPDFYGPTPVDRGFDQLLRTTDAGRNFNEAVGAALASLGTPDAAALEEDFARIAASGHDFVSFSIQNGATGADVDVRLTDSGGRALVYTGADTDPRPAVTSAVIAPLGEDQRPPLFGLIAAPTALPYTLELSGHGATPTDVTVTYPRGDGSFSRATAIGVVIGAGGKARVVIDPSRASPAIEVDANGDGSIDSATPLSVLPISATAPKFVSASVVGPETFGSAGPFGFNVALLFDRIVDDETSADRTRYSIPDNEFYSARRQLSGRLVLGTLAYPEGPYVPSSVTVTGMADLRGATGGAEMKPLQSRLEAPGAVVSGRVINGDGQLAAGVRVIYSGNNNWNDCQTTDPPKPFAAAVTDAQGRYQFRYVYQDKCGFAWGMRAIDDIHQSQRLVSGKVRTRGERITADIALLGRGAITGIVKNLAGQPVPGAQVIVVSTLETHVGGATTTDGDGRYLVSDITVGPVSIKAAKGFASGVASGQIARAGMIAQADLTLNEGSVSVSGVVKTIENDVLLVAPGAVVVFERPAPIGNGDPIIAGVAIAGPDGSYSFTGMPTGAHTIRARIATGDFVNLQGVATAGDVITGRNLIIEIVRNAKVSGIVRYPDGSAAARAIVQITGSGGVVAGEDGTFTIEGVKFQSSTQGVLATSADGMRIGSARVLVLSGQHVTNVEITLNGVGTLNVAVIDSAGLPVRNQIVQISRTGHNISPNDCTAFYLATTDNNGHVQFAGLEVGQVRVVSLRATANGVDVAKLETAIPYEGAEVNGVLRFGGGGSIRGTVTDEDGNPIFGANIEVSSKIYQSGSCSFVDGVSHRIRTALDGTYRVTGVPVGGVSIKASQEFYPTPVGASGVLARDGDELVLNARLINTIATAEQLVGTVFLPDGVTPAGAGVSVTAKGSLPDVVVTTNDLGKFVFPEILPIGGYRVTVRDPASGGVAQANVSIRAKVPNTEPVPHNFRLKGRGTVRVTVVDGAGDEVSNALVSLKESEFPSETFEAVVEESNEGVVTFENVHEGDFSVSASDSVGRGGRVSGELPADGASVDVTVRLTVTGTVTGRFLMPDGVTPIPFGALKLLANGRVIGQVASDSGENAGEFSFNYVPAGSVRIDGLDPATGRSGVAVGQIVTDGQTLELDVKAQGLGTVTGQITSNGAPQSGAYVDVSSGTFKAQTTADGNGVYSIPGVPEGLVTVKANIGGSLQNDATGTLIGEGGSVEINVALQDSGTVTGVITRANSTAAAPPSIVTIKVGNSRLTATTDDLGAYRFDVVPAGARTITVDVIGSIDTATAIANVTAGATAEVNISLNGVGSISGHAQDANGSPVDGTVTLTGTGALTWSMTLSVNSDGSFGVAQALAGPFTAQVRHTAGGFTLYGTSAGVVAPLQTTPITVTLQSTAGIHGVVRRADNATPAVGATVKLLDGNAIKATTQVFTSGAFSFTGLPLDTYSITVQDPTSSGYARLLGLTLAQNGEDRDAGVIVLDDTLPAVLSVDPLDGATGVPPTQRPITITFSDPLASTTGVNLKEGTNNLSPFRELSSDGRVVTLTGAWPDGATITVEVTTAVTDVFGRHPAATFTSHFATVDTTKPTVTVTPVDDAIQVPSTTAIVATFSEPIVNTSLDGLIVVKRLGIVVPGTTVQGPANVLTFTANPPLSDNSVYTVTVDGAIDASGNEQGSAKNTNFATIDTVDPVLTITSPSLTAWVTDNTPSIVVTRLDPTSGVNLGSGTLKLNGTTVVANPTTSTMSYAVPAASPLADADHVIVATSADRAGNTGGSVSGTFKVDATAPSVPVITLGNTTIVGSTTISATSDDARSGVDKISFYVDGGSPKLTLSSPPYSGTLNASNYSEGKHFLTAVATDEAGNDSAPSAPIEIIVDNEQMVLAITAPPIEFSTRRPFTASATVSETVDRVEFTLGGITVPGVKSGSTYSALLQVKTLDVGDHDITVTAYGLLGEVKTATRSIEIDRSTPVARWPFDEGSGVTTADLSGNGHPGTLVNGAAWSAIGQFAKSISFDGVDDGVSVADHDDFDAANGLTMTAWVAPAQFGAPQSLIYRGGSYELSLEIDGRVTGVIYPNGVAVVATTLNPLPLTVFSHVAATYDQAALRLYVNGVEAATTAASGPLATTDGAVWLGRAEVGDSLNGKLDEVRIYDRALTDVEVATVGGKARRLAAAEESSFLAQPNGPVWAWGRQLNADLGVGGSNSTKPRPLPVVGMTGAIAVAAGSSHGLVLMPTGTVYAFGDNFYGQLGTGNTTDAPTPVPLQLDSIVAIAAGQHHSLALRSNGDVYSWGRNLNGQQGNSNTALTFPSPHVIMTGVKAIAAGSAFSLFVKSNGEVWGIGADGSSQLGAGPPVTSRSVAIQMSGITNALDASAGSAFSIIRLDNGTLMAAGDTDSGQLGIGSSSGDRTTPVAVLNLTDVIRTVSGYTHTLALKADGTVWAWGANNNGALGDGTDVERSTPFQVPGLTGIADIGAGENHSLVASESGVVTGWGNNGWYEVGEGVNNLHTYSPVQITAENYVWKVARPQLGNATLDRVSNHTGSNVTAVVSITEPVTPDGPIIRYTQNGLDPTENDPVMPVGNFTVSFSQTLSLKAFKTGMPPSNVERQTYILAANLPTITPSSATVAPNQSIAVTMTKSGLGTIRYTTGIDAASTPDPTENSTAYTAGFSVSWPTRIVKAATFNNGWTTSAVRTATYTYKPAAPTLSPAGGPYTGSVTVTITPGFPGFGIRYATGTGTLSDCNGGTAYTSPLEITVTTTIRAYTCQSGYAISDASTATTYNMTLAAPTFSLAAGSYAPGTVVTVSGNPLTTIRYTLDGRDPIDTDAIVANGGTITLGNFTLKARAFLTGSTQSAVTSAEYTTGEIGEPAIGAGHDHSLLAMPDGRLFGWGAATTGRLGSAPSTADRLVPTLIHDLTGVVKVAGGEDHSLAITMDGKLWAFGGNGSGELGDGSTTTRTRPVQVSTWTNVAAIAAGANHSLALLANGDLYAWGSNSSGKLCDGGSTNSSVPKFVMSGVKAIGAGINTTHMVKTDGSVWSCGFNGNGQLGDNSTTSRAFPTQMSGISSAAAVTGGNTFSVVLLDDGTLLAAGEGDYIGTGLGTNSKLPLPVAVLSGVIAVDAGYLHTIALKADGTVWAWGLNSNGQLGHPVADVYLSPIQIAGLANVTAIHSTWYSGLALTPGRQLFGWGWNGNGQLGDGTVRERWSPIAITDPNLVFKVPTPTLSLTGSTFPTTQSTTVGIATLPEPPQPTIRYTLNGADPTENDSAIAANTVLPITVSQTVSLRAFRTGMPPSNVERQTYILQVPAPTISPATLTLTTLPSTLSVSMNLLADTETRYTMGTIAVPPPEPTATTGQVYSAAFPISTPTIIKARRFRAGWTDSTTTTAEYRFRPLPPTVNIPTGSYTGTINVELTPSVPGATVRYSTTGTLTGCTQGTLYTGPIPITVTTTLRAYTCMVSSDYTISAIMTPTPTYTMTIATPTVTPGGGTYPPGTPITINGDPRSIIRYTLDNSAPSTTSPEIAAGGTVIAGNYLLRVKAFRPSGGTSTPESPIVDNSYAVTSALGAGTVATGDEFAVFSTPDGRVMAWGENSWSQLGDGTSTPRKTPVTVSGATGVVAVSATWRHTLAVTFDGRVLAWGNNSSFGILGDGTTSARNKPVQLGLSNIVQVSAGFDHSLALASDGTVYAWGSGFDGQLGTGQNQSLVPVLVPGLPPIAHIAAGDDTSFAVTTTGELYAWGQNDWAQLGNGDVSGADQWTPQLIAGLSNLEFVEAGFYHTLARTRDGRLFAWGANDYHQLGAGFPDERSWVPIELPGISPSHVTNRMEATFAMRSDGTLLAWGWNEFGQLGNGTNDLTVPTPTPVSIPAGAMTFQNGTRSIAVMPSGDFWTWGNANFGYGYGDQSTVDRFTPQLAFNAAGFWAPAAPVFSVAPGTHADAVTLVITSSLPGSTIRYTVDGSTPDESSPEVPANGEVLINSSTTVRARVFAPNRKPSAITAGAYVIQP